MWKFLLTLCAVVHLCQGRLPEEKALCRDPFVEVGDQCLYFATIAEVTNANARLMCQSLGAELAAFVTATQFKNVVDYIYSQGYDGSAFWIDGSDSGHEGQWLTSDGHSLPMGTPFWDTTYYNKEPNNERGSENCIEMRPSYFYYQNDKNCEQERFPLCEMKSGRIAEPVTRAKTCPSLFVPVGNHCIAFVTWTKNPWDEARDVCHALQAKLAIVNDIEMLRDIYLYLHQESILNHSFWIGGSDIHTEGSWTWTNGQSVSMGSPFWGRVNNGYPQQPDGGTAENCLYLDHKAGHYFFDGDCNQFMNFLCMK